MKLTYLSDAEAKNIIDAMMNTHFKLDTISPVLRNHIFSYKKYLYDEKTMSKFSLTTKKQIICTCLHFEKFLGLLASVPSNISQVDESYIDDYLNFCQMYLKNNNKTINKKIRYLSYFFEYAKTVKLLVYKNPISNFKYLVQEKESEISYIPYSKLVIIKNKILNHINGSRDVSIIDVILDTGLPLIDVLNIKLSDIDFENNQLIVYRHKFDDYFTYDLRDETIKNINIYLGVRSNLDKYNNSSLWLSRNGNVYSNRCFELTLKYASEGKYKPKHIRSLAVLKKVREKDTLDEVKITTAQNKLEHYQLIK